MLTPDRIAALRVRCGLRQQDLAFLLGVGVATPPRWEREGGAAPGGLPGQLLEIMAALDATGVDLSGLRTRLSRTGNLATVRWLLSQPLPTVPGGP